MSAHIKVSEAQQGRSAEKFLTALYFEPPSSLIIPFYMLHFFSSLVLPLSNIKLGIFKKLEHINN